MKTKIQNLFIALAWLALPALVQAQFTFTTNNGAITITGYNTAAGLNVVIPAMTNGYPVTSIGVNAFQYSGITNVTIPNSVTNIGGSAFYHCSSLTSVTIPNSVTSIGNSAFYQCGNLRSVTIPNSVTNIGDSAFELSGLTSVTIPNSVTSIGVLAFAYCPFLTNVTIPNSVTSIGADTFYDCNRLTSVTIPNSVTSIGELAFAYCSSLTSVTIPNSVTSIVGSAFYDCTRLTSVTIPNSVTSIGDYAFNGCGGLTNVTLANGLTSIGAYAFSGGEYYDADGDPLTSVTIPGSVTNIGVQAFDGCSSLTSVTIPNSVTSIGGDAFLNCYSLTAITVDTNNPAYSSLNGVLFDKSQTTLIEYPGGLIGGSYTIPNSVTSIGELAFAYCTRLTSVTIPGSVTSIGQAVFYYDDILTSVYFTGNAPSPTNDSTVFNGNPYSDPATVYYLPGTTGWGAMFDGRPTAPWFLPNPQILNHSASFGVQPGGFGFTISWATNVSVVVEAATNLANPVWIPVSTNTLTGGTNYFSDQQWTNYPGRFYRLRSP